MSSPHPILEPTTPWLGSSGIWHAWSTKRRSASPRLAHPCLRSLGQAVYEAALHKSYHVGEIATLRMSLGKARIG